MEAAIGLLTSIVVCNRKAAGRRTGPQRSLTFVVHFEAFHLVLTRQRFGIVIT